MHKTKYIHFLLIKKKKQDGRRQEVAQDRVPSLIINQKSFKIKYCT